jgi:DNA-binding FadR family transcriptional regulator
MIKLVWQYPIGLDNLEVSHHFCKNILLVGLLKRRQNGMENSRIYKKIAEGIKEKIKNNTYPVGARLPPERDLSIQLAVSRTSVREAIIALEVSGWVDVKIGSGVYVKKNDHLHDMHATHRIHPQLAPHLNESKEVTPFELLQARLFIEPEIAALAATSRSEEQIALIKDAYMMNVGDNLNHSTEHIGDRLFHIRIAEAANNEAYTFFIRHLLSQQYTELFGRLQQLYTPDDMPLRSQLEHHSIYVALAAKDANAARTAMRAHLESVIRIFMRSIDPE